MKLYCDKCEYSTKSQDMLKRHLSKVHEVKKPRGRQRLPNKKSRAEINRNYRQKLKREGSETTAASRKPKPKPKPKAEPAAKKTWSPMVPEEKTVVGQFHWLGDLSVDEAHALLFRQGFWVECIENLLDPMWAYRYIMWRTGHPKYELQRMTLWDVPPDHRVVRKAIIEWLVKEFTDDRFALQKKINLVKKNIKETGRSFWYFPLTPTVCGWKDNHIVPPNTPDCC